jgi:hypothetical protein
VGTWRALIAETVTGTVVSDVVMSAQPQFSRALCDKGSWSVDLHIDAKANRGVDFHSYTQPARYSWVIAYNDSPVQAGPVWTYAFKETTRTLTVAGSGMGGLFGRRVLRNPGGAPVSIADPSNDLTYTNLSLRGILRQLISDNLTQTGYAVPIDLPATETGTNTRTYNGYDLAKLWDRLTELAQVINGPEFDFVPVLTNNGGNLRTQLVVGSPTLGDAASYAVWDYGAALSTIDIDVNGSTAPVTRVWTKGAGQNNATVIGYTENTSLINVGYPGLDYVDSTHTSDTNINDLNAYAAAAAHDFATATETWTCTVRIDGLSSQGVPVSPGLDSWGLGDAPQFGISQHPWIADGLYRRRILGFSQSSDPYTLALKIGSTPMVI